MEHEEVPDILHPFSSQAFRSLPRHCWHPFVLPLPHKKQSSANNAVDENKTIKAKLNVTNVLIYSPTCEPRKADKRQNHKVGKFFDKHYFTFGTEGIT